MKEGLPKISKILLQNMIMKNLVSSNSHLGGKFLKISSINPDIVRKIELLESGL